LLIFVTLSHEFVNNRIVITTRGTYPWSFGTQIFRIGYTSHGSKKWPQLNH